MLVGFAILGSLATWRTEEVGWQAIAFWSIGLILFFSAQFTGLGRAAYLAVYVPSSIIGFVISQVVLLFLFGLVFVPIAWVLRIRGVDELRRKRPLRPTYWIRLDQAPRSYYHQF